MDKQHLNSELKSITKLLTNKVVIESSLIELKWVNVKKERSCFNCKQIINKDDISLTSSKRDELKGFPTRIHRCMKCGLGTLKAVQELQDVYNEDDLIFDIDSIDF